MSFFGYLLYLDWICHHQLTEHEKTSGLKISCVLKEDIGIECLTFLAFLYRFYVSFYTFFPATKCQPHTHACLTFQTAVRHLGY